jgi:ABC-type transporter Mla MlaB component
LKICKKGTVAYLQGDLTHSGVTDNITNLLEVSLQNIVSRGDNKIRINCEKILKTDIRGLQMLYVWMQGARNRGVEPELINQSYSLRLAMERMQFTFCFTDISNRNNIRILYNGRN